MRNVFHGNVTLPSLSTMLRLVILLVVALALLALLRPNAVEATKAPSQQWVARYNSSGNADDWGSAIAVDGSGNVYVTGPSAPSSGTICDYATIKYNNSGAEQWVAQYNGPGNGDDKSVAIAVDGSGNVYVTGSSTGIGTAHDYATIKYNNSGVQQWVATYNGPGNGEDRGSGIAIDGSGNVYVTGYSTGSGTSYDYATIKYNNSGVQQWVATYNGPGNGEDWGSGIAIDGSGNVYVTGYSMGSGTAYDYATIKYNDSGVQQWVARYNGPGNLNESVWAIAVDGSGNVYVSGSEQSGRTSFDSDYATIKYSSIGVEQWVTRYNGPGNGNDFAYAMTVDGSGDVYVTGSSTDSKGFNNFATVKYNSINGSVSWVSRYNGTKNSNSGARAITIDQSGNVYVSGSTTGSMTDFDYATIKYDKKGVQRWVGLYNGPGNGNDSAFAIAVDALGYIYVTGSSTGSSSEIDFATIKY